MRVSLCPWPGNRVPGFLMVDDLGDLQVGDRRDGDWGFRGSGPGSTWEFFETTYKGAVKDLKVVFFACVGRFRNSRLSSGVALNRDGKFPDLLRHIARQPWAEIAFHGVDHMTESGGHECEVVEDVEAWLKGGRDALERIAGTRVLGGKCPAYRGFERVSHHLAAAGFSWWADSWTPVKGRRKLWGGRAPILRDGVWLLPSNLGAFTGLYARGYHILRRARMPRTKRALLLKARYLAEKGLPVIVQTHYAARRPDDTRQAYNLYDDRVLLLPLLSELDGFVQWTLPGDMVSYLETVRSLRFETEGFVLKILCDRPLSPVSFKLHPSPRLLVGPGGRRILPRDDLFTFIPRGGAYSAVF